MAVGMRLKFAGGTQEQYEAVHGAVDADANPPEGMLFHMAGPVDGGWGIIDAWESRGHFDTFQAERLMPAIQSLGDRAPQGPPDIKEFPIHHYTKP